IRDLATRRISAEIPSTFIVLLTAAAVTLCGGALIPLTGGWEPMTMPLLAVLITAAVLVLAGYQFIIQSMRIGDISFVAPFRYTALLWAIAAGYIVFLNVPDIPMLIGSFVVVASGLYTLYRERIVGRSRPVTETTGPSTAVDGL
ncbi:MAG: EamA/RhaT family transporter, partial [Rhizobiaceae bacterium]